METQLTPFDGEKIRKIWHEEQWFFSVVDVIGFLTDSPIPRNYWTKVKKTLLDESQLHPFWMQLKLKSADGKTYKTDCADTKGVFRILMAVPSPKAEPVKRWLAALGEQSINETENPELLTERQAELYKAKGYTDEWIRRRMQTIETRKELTDEWQQRGVKEGQEYAVLTATIAKGTFGLTPTEHKDVKGLDRQNLRDHMTPLELILTAFGEEVTRRITIREDAQGFNENLDAAQQGGEVAGEARLNAEKKLGEKVVSNENFLNLNAKNDVNSLNSDSKKG
jgi:DNA-damage-inducible protein D